MAAPGARDAVAYLRAFRAGDLDAQATILEDAELSGLPAIVPLMMNMAHLVQLAADGHTDVDAMLDRVHHRLVVA